VNQVAEHRPAFRRPSRDHGRQLLGVCAGLARRWHLDARTVRAAFVVTLVPFGAGLLIYGALAVAMPVDGASDADAGRRGDIGRSFVEALVVLAGVLVVGVLGVVGTTLAVFGLGSLALLVATAALAGVVLIDHPRVWLLGLATLALALPSAIVALSDTRIARQVGTIVEIPGSAADLPAAGFRAGAGSLLLDLRNFTAAPASVTTIRARADLGSMVVALPTDRCFNLVVDYAFHETWVARAIHSDRRKHWIGSAAGYGDEPVAAHPERGGALVAYGRQLPGLHGRYERPVAASVPTLHLELTSGSAQMIVRDFPGDVGPLDDPRWPARPRTRSGSVAHTRFGSVAARAEHLAGACAAPEEVRRIRVQLRRGQRSGRDATPQPATASAATTNRAAPSVIARTSIVTR
jgi:phage shock protein PspC (stress-responsive transcriptional regulator)